MLTGLIFLSTSCSNRAHFDEQYKKILYIVNSKEKLHYASHEASAESKGSISIYCTGSKLPDEDIHISYIVDEEALQTYNQNEYGNRTELYFTLLPDDVITFENKGIIVKKGEEYGCLNFSINTQALAPNKIYTLPLTITSVPEGYEISEEMHTILYTLKIENEYVGDYVSNYKQAGVAKGDIKKKVQAMSARQILLPLAGKSNFITSNNLDYNKDYYIIIINADNSLTIRPYFQSVVHQDPDQSSYYDPVEKIFYIHYFIEDQYENYIQIDETLSRI